MATIHGADYSEALDGERLSTQMQHVLRVLRDGRWHSVAAISQQLEAANIHAPEPSVSAQIRNLRKAENGGHIIERKRITDGGLYAYRLAPSSDIVSGGGGL